MVFTGHLPRQIPHRYSPRGFYVFPSTRYQSMWAEGERQNFRSSLKPISVTPAPRSVHRSATSRSRSAPAPVNFFSRSLTAPLPRTQFSARSAYMLCTVIKLLEINNDDVRKRAFPHARVRSSPYAYFSYAKFGPDSQSISSCTQQEQKHIFVADTTNLIMTVDHLHGTIQLVKSSIVFVSHVF